MKRGRLFGVSYQDVLKKGRGVVVGMEDLKASVENDEVLVIMRIYGVPGRNVSGERLLELCSDLELVIENTYFRKKGITKLTW